MTDLKTLAAKATAFATTSGMTVVPALPDHDMGPQVQLDPDTMDLTAFLELARTLGAVVLYVETERFTPDEDSVADPPAHLLAHRGQTAHVGVAFHAHGLTHYWERPAPWYVEWNTVAADRHGRHRYDDDEGTPFTDAEREQLAVQAAEAVMAKPEFRAAKGGNRQRLAQLHLPAGTDPAVGWRAIRIACDRAEAMTDAVYTGIIDQMDALAADLLHDPGWREANAPSTRKAATERFLIARKDGFSPPSGARDELYARTQKLAKRPQGTHLPV